MTEKKPVSFVDFDQENEITIQQQINESYQSGVADYLDQGKSKSKAEDEESLQ
ncbi:MULTISPECIES: hypothetical protein [Fictibacillus]|uniref:Uncharacterized protein n=1 Tax=Fictibacillus terranigra TaxID=3058424 RepID=A0ABT8E3W9_9BACL|nr:hypothetical protein [Fictibacillus sp. CENA-BCM004]MDN4072607.1 hypothetical protein [Fictibacillus sp. CENA-BCM004]